MATYSIRMNNEEIFKGNGIGEFRVDVYKRQLSTMAIGTTSSALNFEYLNSAMSTVGPVANSFGFTIAETTSLLGALANSGFCLLYTSTYCHGGKCPFRIFRIKIENTQCCTGKRSSRGKIRVPVSYTHLSREDIKRSLAAEGFTINL